MGKWGIAGHRFCQIANIAILEIWQFGDLGAVALSFFVGKQVWRLSGVNSAELAEREMNDRKPLLLLGKIMCGCVNGACGVNTTTTAERGGSKKTKRRTLSEDG